MTNVPSVKFTHGAWGPNDPYRTNGTLSLPPPNEMQYTIGKLYSTDREGTQPSVRIERIAKPSAPFTISPLMRCNIRSVNCTGTQPSVRIERIVKPSAPLTNITRIFFLSFPNEMQYTNRDLCSTERKGT